MVKLRETVTCLHCWSKFRPTEVVWQSVHRDLLGDPLLGPDEQMRFLPTRFTVERNAIDPRGQTCFDIACPRCHLPLPKSLLERSPLFVSILGSPACGKSFYLAALASTLRRDLPARFRLDFRDADTVSNQVLVDYEEHIFLHENPDVPTSLGDLIPKTQLGGNLYNTVTYGQQTVSYPRPFSFSFEPTSDHPNLGMGGSLKKIVCLYDNAGEHFLPGNDSATAPGTRHMAESSFLLFLYDPTQDPRWHAAVKRVEPALNIPRTRHAGRQEGILREAAQRICRFRGMSDGAKHDRPLIVILNKVDLWSSLLPRGKQYKPQRRSDLGIDAISFREIDSVSLDMRELLMKHLPEIVFAAESFAETVYYLPVSALGHPPTVVGDGQFYMKPARIRPKWVTIPFLLGLSLVTAGLIPTVGVPDRQIIYGCD